MAVKLFLADMDGTLTDGGKYLTAKGEETKKFHIPDGMGFVLLQRMGIQTGIITSERSGVVNVRGEQLRVNHLVVDAANKLKSAQELSLRTHIPLSEMAFIGDDVNDYDLLSEVGFPACPGDAQDLIKTIPRIRVMRTSGGYGAVREFMNLLFGAEAFLQAWRKGES